MNDAIPLARPALSEDDRRAVLEVLDSGRLSGGPRTLLMEQRLAGVCGVAGAVAVSSGTAGLVLALRSCGVGPGDEVITSPFTFVATVSAIHHVGAVPVLVDIEPGSWNIDPATVAAAVTRRTRAILPVHVFGRPAAMLPIMDIARKNGLRVIEDACEAIGSRLGGTACGAFGDAGVFGFYPNKVIVSGEGGAICSDDPGILDWCRRFRNHGRLQDSQEMGDEPGGNFRLSELHAALAASQLRRLDALIRERQRLADTYRRRLDDIAGLVPHADPAGDAQVSRFAFVVRLGEDSDAARRDAIRSGLAAAGIETGHYFPTVDRLPPFSRGRARIHGSLEEAHALSERVIALPFFPGLEDTQIERVADALRAELSRPARG